ncbi:MAG: nucleotidyltransferase domain-containing protein [Promethearchaeota archaeon]|nr:MAG: nucleotidyltransferase domain-containing protein [Candidatus Lokiarchaeota archaeon]
MERTKISDSIEQLIGNAPLSKKSIIIGYFTTLLHEANIKGEVFLFGSYARGDYQPDSDVDLLINADQENTKKITTLASKMEWTFEIPVQVLSINDFEILPSEAILIYTSFRKPRNDIFRLITYNYSTNDRSRITVFSRQLLIKIIKAIKARRSNEVPNIMTIKKISSYCPKRRWRCWYARIARQMSIFRISGQ